MSDCRYLLAPSEFVALNADGRPLPPVPAPRMLCAWGVYHPASAAALASAPPSIARTALSGAAWRDGDCARCPVFEAGEPVEGCGR